jgi:anti-sigma B factor antagonist
MNIQEDFKDGVHIFNIEGDLDASSALQLDQRVRAAIEDGHHKLFFCLETLNYIASAGLGVFISHREKVYSKGGKMVFGTAQPNVKNTFEILGLVSLFRFVDDCENPAQFFAES